MPLKRNKRKGNISKSGALTISPKNQISIIDNLQGQIPIDLSIDGNQLLDTKNHFSDEYLNYNFNSQYSNPKGPSAGFPNNDENSNFFISTPNTLGVNYFSNHRVSLNSLKDSRLKKNLSKNLGPFKEDNLIDLNSQKSFYLTSSNPDIIKNFDQPVKDRVVIDFSLESNSSVTIEQSKTDNKYNFMAYYNFVNKNWDMLDNNYQLTDFGSGNFQNQNLHIGFSSTIFGDGNVNTGGGSNATREYISGALSEPISNFGFPIANKYKSTNEQMLSLKNYIDKPFLLEKVILEFNYSSSGNMTNSNDNLIPFIVGNNFFILNQKETKSNRKLGNISEIISKSQVSANFFSDITNDGYYGTIDSSLREIISYSKIILATTGTYDLSTSNSNYNFNQIESEADYYEYADSSSGDCSYSITNKRIKVEFPVRIANKSKYFSKLIDVFTGNEFGSRTLVGEDFNRSFFKNNDSYKGKSKLYAGTSTSNLFSKLDNSNRDSAYILLPDDKIIFGLHSLSNILGNHNNSFTIIGSVNIKLIGTPLSNYMPKEEVRKEFLTSNNTRSAIVGDTYLSDQFETFPIQLYASSSIDRIVNSDSTNDLGRSSSTFYSSGNKGTNIKSKLLLNNNIFNVEDDIFNNKKTQKSYFNWRRFGNLRDFIDQGKKSAFYGSNNRIEYLIKKDFYNVNSGILSNPESTSNIDSYSRISKPFKE